MKRLAVRLFSLFSAVSLLLCVAVCVLWVRSFSTADVISVPLSSVPRKATKPDFASPDSVWNTRGFVLISEGSFALRWVRVPAVRPNPPAAWRPTTPRPLASDAEEVYAKSKWRLGGFAWCYDPDPRGEYWRVTAPCWSVAVAAAVLPVTWLARSVKAHRRNSSGLCSRCGYDLRASPERCPECGAGAANSH